MTRARLLRLWEKAGPAPGATPTHTFPYPTAPSLPYPAGAFSQEAGSRTDRPGEGRCLADGTEVSCRVKSPL